ncbi:metallophosphoesterase [Thermofilum pendens]|uniref:Bis(5'nucleosyl)-tetraphosphatase, ApaH n=1 Tax=Thermofilum pendens (strain DSM 2475 / Hrk 5) TaxID=368408 RepID=A1RX13_THEPD|nr:metallophosphoesterase [Thermofilum pendens]ABL77743.1 bis(5'nucleosyl)-tetraphosphatase, ApaH [Thermofilum pendens Hrk 5]
MNLPEDVEILGRKYKLSLTPEELKRLLEESKKVLSSDPPLVEVKGKRVLFVGDTHGDVESTINAFREAADVYVFLGDYVDRGRYQLENIVLLLQVKRDNRERIVLLRGNHETRSMNMVYGFLRVVITRYGERMYDLFEEVFSQMSYGALVNREVLAVHGGIPKGLSRVEEIQSLKKEQEPSDPRTFQLLWNDPDEGITGFEPSPRGEGIYLFGEDVARRFLDENGLKLLVRGHEPVQEGVKFLFGERVATVFSCRYYGITPTALLLDGEERRRIRLDEGKR